MPRNEENIMSLCNVCDRARACPKKGCSWFRFGVPVAGWEAFERSRHGISGVSYCVTACPQFLPDRPTPKEKVPTYELERCAPKRNRHLWKGQWMLITDIARMEGLPVYGLRRRLRSGMGVQAAVKDALAHERNQTGGVTYKGETRSLKEWSKVLGIPYSTLRWRRDCGWTTDRLFSKSPEKSRQKKEGETDVGG